jgi:hypothetical protein
MLHVERLIIKIVMGLMVLFCSIYEGQNKRTFKWGARDGGDNMCDAINCITSIIEEEEKMYINEDPRHTWQT